MSDGTNATNRQEPTERPKGFFGRLASRLRLGRRTPPDEHRDDLEVERQIGIILEESGLEVDVTDVPERHVHDPASGDDPVGEADLQAAADFGEAGETERDRDPVESAEDISETSQDTVPSGAEDAAPAGADEPFEGPSEREALDSARALVIGALRRRAEVSDFGESQDPSSDVVVDLAAAEIVEDSVASAGHAGTSALPVPPAEAPDEAADASAPVEASAPEAAVSGEAGRDDEWEERVPTVLRSDGSPLPRHRLGEYVLNKGLITPEALDAASREQEVTGKRIGQILVANGFLSDRDRVEAILETSSERIALESVARSRIPADILDEHNIFISAETEDTVYVSTMGDEETVRAIVEEYYGDRKVSFVAFLPGAMNSFISSMRKSSSTEDLSQSAETMLDRLLYRALADGASDIHILPRRESYTAMFRLLGVRRIVHEGALDEFKVMIAQIKDRARMDLAERRKPQDGGFQIEYAGKMIDLRVATLPTQEGETCVMRVLDPDRVQPSLGKLGITRVDRWRKGFSQQHGLCLICGPTGSGKTTTLNSSIKEMDRFGKAIYSIEDPVEYRVPYAGQVSVNSSVGLNFASAVRAFMRADPDVIVLGEVRDEETARNAMKAADTGHLVLATLHTGSILGAVSRLRDLGVEPRELRYLLRSVLVQTLVRTTCPRCGGKGCEHCGGSGYAGRTVVSECEYFQDYDSVDMLLKATGESEVRRTWPTMLEDAVQKMREGQTDLKELYRVFGAAVDMHLHEEEKAAWPSS